MITVDWEPIPWAIFKAKKYKGRVYKVHTADSHIDSSKSQMYTFGSPVTYSP